MIWSWIFQVIFTVLTYFLGFLPDVSTSSGFGAAITAAGEYVAVPYAFFPLITASLLSILAYDIVFETGYIVFKAVYWVIKRFPTQS